jgi:hypothetical protein
MVTTIQTREATKPMMISQKRLFMMVKKRWQIWMKPLWRRMMLMEK